MANKISQKKIILNQLRNNGFVTRNYALSQYISRLGAIICLLKKQGMNITAESMENGDFKYLLLDKPKITRYFVNGVKVSEKVEWK